MKRVWAAAAFAVFIILSIGTYYVQTSYHHLPEFRLARVAGDAAEAKTIVLNGHYVDDSGGEPVQISVTGSKYDRERSFVERIEDSSPYKIPSPALARLVREYRSFCRGVNLYTGHYLNAQDVLVRADFKAERPGHRGDETFHLRLTVLDKKTNRTHSFETMLPEQAHYAWMRVMDVQYVGSRLKIAVLGNKLTASGGMALESHIYDVHVSDGQISADHKLSFEQIQSAGKQLEINEWYESDPTRPNDNLLFQVSVKDTPQDNADARKASAKEPADMEYVAVYHYDSGKLDFISWPEVKQETGYRSEINQDGDSLFWAKMNGNEVKLKRFRLSDDKLVNELSLKKEDFHAESFGQIQFDTNRIYLLLHTPTNTSVAAVDPTSGQIVYQGEIAAEGGKDVSKERLSSLELYGFTWVP